MNGIRIIVPADTEIDVVTSIITAAWKAGVTRVSVEREIPVVVDMSIVTGEDVCDGSEECHECEAVLCSITCQEARQNRKIAKLKEKHIAQKLAIIQTAAELNEAIYERH